MLMSNYFIKGDTLTAIADAIRTKNGSADTYTPAEMAEAVTNLSTSSSEFTGHYDAEGLADIRGLICSGITSSAYYANALYGVPTTAKIIVKDDTEKTWWQSAFSSWSDCFYTVDEAIEAGIVDE